MNDQANQTSKWNEQRFRNAVAQRFSLLQDKADDESIERRIREGMELSGATPWILIFAILVASIGLNVNSTAVIIGAMLISPLMGPIMCAGLGVALYDFDLVKRSLVNLGIATLISLVVSTLYFTLSPLREAQSELLARTSPTIWDVMIALFGGLAGIIGVTRKEKSNVIPGVAIATALMPPVCTAGYALATGQWRFFGGALYLYTINCVFISLATMIGIRVLRLKRHGFETKAMERRVKFYLLMLALGTALPSAYLAVALVKDELFKAQAQKFVTQEFTLPNTHVAETQINTSSRTIELALIGEPLSQSMLNNIEARLATAQLQGAKIVVHQNGDNRLDVTSLKSSLLSDLYQNAQQNLQQKEERIQSLQGELTARNELFAKAQDMSDELKAQYPSIQSVFVSEGIEFSPNTEAQKFLQLSVKTSRTLVRADQTRIENWFKARSKADNARVVFER